MSANLHHERGNDSYRRGEFKEAGDHFSRAIQTEPRNFRLFTNRAACRFMQQQYKEALTDAEYSIKLRPRWSKGHFWKGACLFKLGDKAKLPQVRGALSQSLRLDAENEKARQLLQEVNALLQMEEQPRGRQVGKKRTLDEDVDLAEEEPQYKKKKTPKEVREDRKTKKFHVDYDSGHAHHGEILKDECLWNVALDSPTQACRLQIIRVPGAATDDADDKYYFWFRVNWKKSLSKNQTQCTELTIDEAKFSFRRMFRDRTGNDWEDRGKFQKIPGKFAIDYGYIDFDF